MVSIVHRSTRMMRRVILAGGIAIGVSASGMAQLPPSAGGSGVIEGRIVDDGTGNPLPGAQVLVTGSSSETSTDRDGRFRLATVPAGDRTVVVTYLGRHRRT